MSMGGHRSRVPMSMGGHRSPLFLKKNFYFCPGFLGVSRGCTSRFLECTKMIGIIWESVLRVPILLLLSDGFLGGPARGPRKEICKKVAIFFRVLKKVAIFFSISKKVAIFNMAKTL